MNIADKTVKQILLEKKKIAAKELAKLEELATHDKKPLQEIVLKQGLIDEEELLKLYAAQSETPFIKLDPKSIDLPLPVV